MSTKFTPDALTNEKAKSLKSTKFWRDLGSSSALIWGACKSNGLTFYNVAFEKKTQTFKCNCASRKYPCKHAVALFMLFSDQPNVFIVKEKLPEWISQWLSKEKNIRPLDTPEAEKNKAENRQKNFSKRLEQMLAGLDELENWLIDTLRQGVASLQQQPQSYWNEISARLYDAKLSAIGNRLRVLSTLIKVNENWPTLVVEELTTYYLLIRGLRRMEELPLNFQQDLLTYAGVTTRKEDLFKYGQSTKDTWMILGVEEKEEENLRVRKAWLFGYETKRYGLVLDYAFGNKAFEKNYKAGNVFIGTAVYYPSNAPLRIAIKEKHVLENRIKRIVGFDSLSSYLTYFTQILAANLFHLTFPCSIEKVTPVLDKGILKLIDAQQTVISLQCSETVKWKILTASGGEPIHVFGSWTGTTLIPLSMSIQNQFMVLNYSK